MGIKDLPKPGINFRAKAGPGNFQKKLSSATRYGDLKNLRDNQKAIVDAVKKRERDIRVKGGLNRLQRRDVRLGIQASDKTITKEDKREIKQILEHLGRGAAVRGKKPIADGRVIKASGKKSVFLTEDQIGRNLRRNMARDESGMRTRQSYDTQYAGGAVRTTYLGAAADKTVAGSAKTLSTMADLNIKTKPTGFAQNYNEDKSAGNPLPEASLKGKRPIGM